MSQIIRRCPDCRRDRPFEQHHGGGWCPVSEDRDCPEWYCLACGAVLLTGDMPILLHKVSTARIRDRVA